MGSLQAFGSRTTPIRNLDQRSLPALDGIRGLAVLLVLAYHGYSRIPGSLGVEIFFVLSGFLITKLLLRELATSGDISVKNFYIRRSLRIFPAFYAYMIAVAFIDRVSPGYYWSAMTYTINYYVSFHGNQGNTMYHLWSLAVEEQFYLLWPFIFVLFCKRLKTLTWLTAALVVGSQFYKLAIAGHVTGDHIYRSFDTRGPEILMGCLAALLLRNSNRVPSWLLSPWMAALSVAELAIANARSNESSVTYFHLADSAVIVILLLQAIHYAPRILDRNPLKYVGQISYSLYLYHPMMYFLCKGLHLRYSVYLLLSTALSFAAATISRYTIEAWFIRLKPASSKKLVPAPEEVPLVPSASEPVRKHAASA